MVTSWPKGLPGLGTGAERLAANITRLSGGRLTIKTYAAGELVPAFECFGAVANGTAQMGHDAAYYHTGKTEGAAFFTTCRKMPTSVCAALKVWQKLVSTGLTPANGSAPQLPTCTCSWQRLSAWQLAAACSSR